MKATTKTTVFSAIDAIAIRVFSALINHIHSPAADDCARIIEIMHAITRNGKEGGSNGGWVGGNYVKAQRLEFEIDDFKLSVIDDAKALYCAWLKLSNKKGVITYHNPKPTPLPSVNAAAIELAEGYLQGHRSDFYTGRTSCDFESLQSLNDITPNVLCLVYTREISSKTKVIGLGIKTKEGAYFMRYKNEYNDIERVKVAAKDLPVGSVADFIASKLEPVTVLDNAPALVECEQSVSPAIIEPTQKVEFKIEKKGRFFYSTLNGHRLDNTNYAKKWECEKFMNDYVAKYGVNGLLKMIEDKTKPMPRPVYHFKQPAALTVRDDVLKLLSVAKIQLVKIMPLKSPLQIKLEKELNKLMRVINSRRFLTYFSDETEEQAAQRRLERQCFITRKDEVLKLLNELTATVSTTDLPLDDAATVSTGATVLTDFDSRLEAHKKHSNGAFQRDAIASIEKEKQRAIDANYYKENSDLIMAREDVAYYDKIADKKRADFYDLHGGSVSNMAQDSSGTPYWLSVDEKKVYQAALDIVIHASRDTRTLEQVKADIFKNRELRKQAITSTPALPCEVSTLALPSVVSHDALPLPVEPAEVVTVERLTAAALQCLNKRYEAVNFGHVDPSRYGNGWTASRNATNANNKALYEQNMFNAQIEYIKARGKLSQDFYEHIASSPLYYQSILGRVLSDSLGLNRGNGYHSMNSVDRLDVQTAIWKKIKSQPIIKKLDRELNNSHFRKPIVLNGCLTPVAEQTTTTPQATAPTGKKSLQVEKVTKPRGANLSKMARAGIMVLAWHLTRELFNAAGQGKIREFLSAGRAAWNFDALTDVDFARFFAVCVDDSKSQKVYALYCEVMPCPLSLEDLMTLSAPIELKFKQENKMKLLRFDNMICSNQANLIAQNLGFMKFLGYVEGGNRETKNILIFRKSRNEWLAVLVCTSKQVIKYLKCDREFQCHDYASAIEFIKQNGVASGVSVEDGKDFALEMQRKKRELIQIDFTNAQAQFKRYRAEFTDVEWKVKQREQFPNDLSDVIHANVLTR